MKGRVVSVTEFKAKCLALLDDIGEHGGSITITRRGQPLATVGPPKRRRRKSSEGIWAGRADIDEDLLMADTSDMWNVVREGKL